MTANALVEENETYFQDLVRRRGPRVNLVLLDAILDTTEKTDPPNFSLFFTLLQRYMQVRNARKSLAGVEVAKLSKSALERVSLAVTFLGRALQQASPAVGMKEAASVLDGNTVLSRPAIELFLLSWKEADKAILEAKADGGAGLDLDRIRQGGTLFDLQWKIGTIVNASTLETGDEITCPYVELFFNVRHLDGSVGSHNFQMSYHEFQDFLSQVKDAAEAMDSV